MKISDWNEGLNNLDFDLVENYVLKKEALIHKKRLRSVWLRVGAVAACLAIIVSAAFVAPRLNFGEHQNQVASEVPILKDGHFSARNMAELFDVGRTEGVATNAYTTVCVPDAKYLYLNDIPDDEYINIYEHSTVKKDINHSEFKEFIDGIIHNVAKSLNISSIDYKIEERESYDGSKNLEAYVHKDNYHIFFSQYETHSGISFSHSLFDDNEKLILDGECVQVDQSLSDEEIIDSIGSIKEKLFEIFGVSFSDVKVVRRYKDYQDNGVAYLYIYFYQKSDCIYNFSVPDSDYISICFDNFKNYAGDTVSDGILTVAQVSYRKYRSEVSQRQGTLYKAKRLDLKEAEELLYKGYVFGGHSCPLCMAAQEKVDFEDYDLVGLEYVGQIPFYAFYKDIGTAKNGNTIYAKTYVPAIKISGYEEYFESQKAHHK